MLIPLIQNLFGAAGVIPPPVPGTGPFNWTFASYQAFRATLQTMIDGDDFSQSTLSSTILDLFVSLGEKRLYKDVRSSTQDAALTLTVTGNVAPLPIDTIEVKSLFIPLKPPLVYLPYEAFQEKLQRQGQVTRSAINFTQEGENLIFYPTQPDGQVINGRYFRQFASIVTQGLVGNTFFARWPELWLFAALLECIPYVGEQTRAPLWTDRYGELVAEIQEYEKRRVTRGSKLATRVA